MRPPIQNPVHFGAFHYLKKRGYKIKPTLRFVREYANSIGINKIDYLLFPELNKIIENDFVKFTDWVKKNVEYKE